MRLINGVITEVFDPNLFYSRLSFLESGKDAIDIKNYLNQGKAYKGFKLPNVKDKFYTRSALVKNLIPMPSDGKIRSKFTEMKSLINYPPLKYKRNTKSFLDQASPSGRSSVLADGKLLAEPSFFQGSPTSSPNRQFDHRRSQPVTTLNKVQQSRKQQASVFAINGQQMVQGGADNQSSVYGYAGIRDNTKSRSQYNRVASVTRDSREGSLVREQEDEQQILELINKVQMFQIACNKVNASLTKRKLKPVFDLSVNGLGQEQVPEYEDIAENNHTSGDGYDDAVLHTGSGENQD